MNKPIKTIAVALAAIAAMSVQQTEACTRATYIGPDNTVITGRTMDWKEDYINAIPQTADAKIAVPSVLSVMRNVSVPFGITTPDKPHISSTRWRSVSDQKNKVYYFESTLAPNLFWLDLKKIDFSPNAGIKKLSLTNGEIYAGDAVKDLKDSKGFVFLFQTPVM